jgi:hypothetical protein
MRLLTRNKRVASAFAWLLRVSGYFRIQPTKPGFIHVFWRDLCDKVRVADVLPDQLLDRATVIRVGLHKQNSFGLFYYLTPSRYAQVIGNQLMQTAIRCFRSARLIRLASSAVLRVA